MQAMLEGSRRLGLGIQRSAACLQWESVRRITRHKPKWLGKAKTKVFKIPVHKEQPTEEFEELQRITQNYRTYMRSLWAFQKEEFAKSEATQSAHAKESTEEAEISKLLEEIERDNAIVKSIREKSLAEEWKKREKDILAQKAAKEREEFEARVETEAQLQAHLEKLKTAIRSDNLDEAIERAIATTIDHNFAIDKTGKFYYGRNNTSQPTAKQEETLSGSL